MNKVLWCYGIHNPNLQAHLQSKGYIVHRGLPTEADIVPHSICILDDLLTESENSKEVTEDGEITPGGIMAPNYDDDDDYARVYNQSMSAFKY